VTSEVKVLRKTVFNFLIAMLLSLVTLAFIVGFSDVSDIMRALGRVSLRWVMLVLVMMVCDWILESFTVKIFSNAYDVDMKFLYAVKITLIGAFTKHHKACPFGFSWICFKRRGTRVLSDIFH